MCVYVKNKMKYKHFYSTHFFNTCFKKINEKRNCILNVENKSNMKMLIWLKMIKKKETAKRYLLFL